MNHVLKLAALLALLVAIAASGMLVADRLGWLGEGLPGCGPNSGCAKATNSALGKLPFELPGGEVVPGPVESWPVSFVGFGFFVSMLAAWLVGGLRAPAPAGFVWMARVGVLASGFYMVMMLMNMDTYFCKYCLASHVSNFVFYGAMETCSRLARRVKGSAGPARGAGSWRAVVSAGVVFLGANLALGAMDDRAQAARAAKQEDNLAAEIAAMQAEVAAAAAQPAPAPEAAPGAEKKIEYPPVDIGLPIPGDETLTREGFTGRYRLGPKEAPIRVVVFSSYQCKDCKRIESELRGVLLERSDVSVSHKHFAFDQTCNKFVDRTLHANSCWAARAAEAAGMLRGNAGFWQMHYWLFDRKTGGEDTPGAFTNAELAAGLKDLGYPDVDEFVKVMNSPETLALVQADIAEAMNYGLFSTPMIFVNGREFKSWGAPNAVKRYIEAVAATNPQPGAATLDRPPSSTQKAVDDWRGSPAQNLQRNWPIHRRGPENAKVRVTLFGDVSEPFTAALWSEILRVTKDRTDVSYAFLSRPGKETCNAMNVPFEKQPACRMARALESAGRLGGAEAYWKMFDWLMANSTRWSEARLPEAAAAAGLDPKTLADDMALEEVMFVLLENQKMFQRSGARGVPTLLVNEKLVLRWKVNDVAIVDKVIEAAASGR